MILLGPQNLVQESCNKQKRIAMPSSPATNSANTYNRKHVKQNVQIVRRVKRKKDKWGIPIKQLCELIALLNNENRILKEQIISREEKIRKLVKKIFQIYIELKSKMLLLQQKLPMQSHQVKQLSKFKVELQKHMFTNDYQNIKFISKLNKIQTVIAMLEIMVNQEGRSSSNGFRQCQNNHQPKIYAKENISINGLLMPKITLPIGLSKSNITKISATQRSKTDRKRVFQLGAQRTQDLEQVGKKYMRTKQLVNARNNIYSFCLLFNLNKQIDVLIKAKWHSSGYSAVKMIIGDFIDL